MKIVSILLILSNLSMFPGVVQAQQRDTTKPASVYPSPMVDYTRPHERIEKKEYPGVAFELPGLFSTPVQAFVPQKSLRKKSLDLVIHFNGAPYVTQFAATKYRGDMIGVTVHIGAGSQVYNDAFLDTTRLISLIDSITAAAKKCLGHAVAIRQVILSGFSAGYGAIRRILSTPVNYNRVDAVLLLDGFHASYVPERRVIAEGGRIDSTQVQSYLALAVLPHEHRNRHSGQL